MEALLDKYIPAGSEDRVELERLLYGGRPRDLPLPPAATSLSAEKNFELAGYKFACPAEQRRPARMVRIGLIQNTIVKPTTAPIDEQYQAIEDSVRVMLDAAGAAGVNIACLQEAWTCPFFFCTREKQPWCEFAEPVDMKSRSIRFVSEMAKKHNMVIIAPILERDEIKGDTLHNTAVVISNSGEIIGKHRKNHIPRTGDFNESTYYMEGDTGHPVFETQFGRIAINICYGRHHPLNWMFFGLNGAEIVFNPSATIGSLSEPLWSIEGRNASIANTYYTANINRVGTEEFPNAWTSGDGKPEHTRFGPFYGSSYVAAPDASRSPSLGRERDGLLVAELDLNLVRQVRDKWNFQMTARYADYAKWFEEFVRPDWKPNIIKDTSVPTPP
mmetsp:Transcript_21259/g.49948  ORF Transcript_21259/g.49948 Transcript_21259/m.49948 type:complete len:387 (+) Transcript_21259:2-1162(+)